MRVILCVNTAKYMLKKISLIIATFLIIIIVLLLFSNYWRTNNLCRDFQSHVSNNDSVLYNGDFLHPRYAYFKNGNLIGLEIYDNPECGNHTEKFYLKNSKIEKITIHKDYYSVHCEEIVDSIYVIDLKKKNILTYVNFKLGKRISKDELFTSELIYINECKKDIKNWNVKK